MDRIKKNKKLERKYSMRRNIVIKSENQKDRRQYQNSKYKASVVDEDLLASRRYYAGSKNPSVV